MEGVQQEKGTMKNALLGQGYLIIPPTKCKARMIQDK
jgi:hypothetical protein